MKKIPEASLIKKEITIRVLHPDENVKLSKQSAIRFIALSLGLISPNETRTGLLDVFEVIFDAHIDERGITSYEIIKKLENKEIDEKTIYYHLKRMQELGIINRKSGEYFLGDGFEKDFIKVIEKTYKENVEEMVSSLREVYRSMKHR